MTCRPRTDPALLRQLDDLERQKEWIDREIKGLEELLIITARPVCTDPVPKSGLLQPSTIKP